MPNGRGDDLSHRSAGAGVVTTLVPPPVIGAGRFTNLTPIPFKGFDSAGSIQCSSLGSFIPHADFPKFDGSNPKIWVKKCESYFDVYYVPTEYWVKLATMNFGGSTAFWMQSKEADLRKCTWEDLCKAVTGRFERDQYNHIIRKFFHVKQSGSVVEYIEAFDELVHQLLAYDPCFSPTVITSRFVDGLKLSIKAVVLLHRPKDLDTASSLAILQEEVLLGHPTFEPRRNDHILDTKSMIKSGFPIASPNKNTEFLSQSDKRGSSVPKSKVQSN